MDKLTGNVKITGHSSIEELLGDIMGYKKHPVQPLVDLPINDYFQTIASFESAMTVGAQYERFSHHDENKSRVDELWEAIESKLHGVNRNWRANTAAVYFVTSSMLELRISEVDELLDKIRDRLKVKEIVWGCVNGNTMGLYLTVDVYHNNIKAIRSTPEELRCLDQTGLGIEKDDDFDRL